MKNSWQNFFSYKSSDRGNRVVYKILLVFLFISFGCNLVIITSKLMLGDNYHGAPFSLSFFLTLLIFGAILLFRKGYTKLINELFLIFLIFIYFNIVYNSKPENEFAVLIMVIYVIVAAITLKGKSFLASIFALILCLLTLGGLQIAGIIPSSSETNFANIAGIAVILLMIVFISWLFNREINDYIAQLQESQQMLQEERDLLETKVAERTEQLQAEQAEKMAEFSRFAEFGRLAQGLFHDLLNPLTALSLNLKEIKKGNEKNLAELSDYIEGATAAATNMEKLIDSTRNYFQHRAAKTSFSLENELESIYKIMHFKAERAGVEMVFQKDEDIKISGNKTRFSQLLSNLILNAIEAYGHEPKKSVENKREVRVSFHEKDNQAIIYIQDNACGMSAEIQQKIFQPFFSTKEKAGNTGIGLTMCKDIAETDFSGKLAVKSEQNKGTRFTISLPLPSLN